jgi:hypothetical protein
MKLLKIESSQGFFLGKDGNDLPIDKISKEDLLRLVNYALDEEKLELDEYDETLVKNQAHQIIYKHVHAKLLELRGRRQEFIDESARLYLEDYQKYKDLQSEHAD